ncbi:MAG: thioredoxin family protein [Desulfobacteraceae bacterium]|nr:thioredoxin family protein [Desulfobacteraceae bacterium]
MNQARTYPGLVRASAALAVLAFLLVFTAGSGFCQSTGQTVEEKYPGLVSGILKNARLQSMDKQILLKSEDVTIRRAELTEKLNGLDAEIRSQMKKNLLFLLDQEATRKILRNEAEKAGLTSEDRSDREIFQALIDRKTETMQVTEQEARNFYQTNRDMVGDRPFEQVKDAIRDYLTQQKKQQFFSDYIGELAADVNMRVNQQWVAKQSRIAMDNPVDKARNSGLPTMVEFGADGCVPCDKMQPILDKLRKDFADSLNVVFVDVREKQMLAARFGIRSIPVQVFYYANGKEVFRHTGFLAKDKVYRQLAEMGVGEQSEAVFTIGSGQVEVVLFTDYFCPPCQSLEPVLDEKLPELIASGAKVTFVDAPFNRRSSLYARYFLYAAKASSSPESIMHARNLLFRLAEKKKVESEKEMMQALKENNVDINLFDTQPVINQWKKIMNKYNLRTTPTCVIIRPGEEPEQYRSGKAIPEALDRLLGQLPSE